MALKGRLKRKLGLLDLTFIGLGSIIGSAWLYASLFAAKIAGPSAWISWLLAAAISCILGLVFAELGSALPRAGGIVRYAMFSHGPAMGYLISFIAFIAYSCVAGLEAQAVRGYASMWWPALGGQNPTLIGWLVQTALLGLFFLLNYWSVNLFGKANTVITFLKFFVPVVTIAVLLSRFHWANFTVHGFAPSGFTGIQTALTAGGVCLAFMGFQQPIFFASEAKRPGRDVPLAIFLSILLATVLYVLLQVSFIGAMPADLLSGGWSKLALQSPFADLVATLGFGWLVQLILADAVLSPGGAGNIYLSATARLVFGWARTGTFFRRFGQVHNKRGVPEDALWLSFLVAILWTLPFPSWDKLVAVTSSAGLVSFIIGPVAVAALRRTAPELARPFRLRGLSVVGPLAYIVSSLIVYWSGFHIVSWLMASVIAMFALYALFAPKRASAALPFPQQIGAAWWFIGYCAMMFLLSWAGTFGGKGFLPAPWDQVAVAVGSLATYYWGAAAAVPSPSFETEEPESAADDVLETGPISDRPLHNQA